LTIFANCTSLIFIFVRFIKKFHQISFVAGRIFSRLSRKLSIFDPICIKSFMLIFDHRIYPESLSVEFGFTLYINSCKLIFFGDFVLKKDILQSVLTVKLFTLH
jgi:hypothetical protein